MSRRADERVLARARRSAAERATRPARRARKWQDFRSQLLAALVATAPIEAEKLRGVAPSLPNPHGRGDRPPAKGLDRIPVPADPVGDHVGAESGCPETTPNHRLPRCSRLEVWSRPKVPPICRRIPCHGCRVRRRGADQAGPQRPGRPAARPVRTARSSSARLSGRGVPGRSSRSRRGRPERSRLCV